MYKKHVKNCANQIRSKEATSSPDKDTKGRKKFKLEDFEFYESDKFYSDLNEELKKQERNKKEKNRNIHDDDGENQKKEYHGDKKKQEDDKSESMRKKDNGESKEEEDDDGESKEEEDDDGENSAKSGLFVRRKAFDEPPKDLEFPKYPHFHPSKRKDECQASKSPVGRIYGELRNYISSFNPNLSKEIISTEDSTSPDTLYDEI
ncbi:unnamed protein product, partial [Rotaria magnacalcarata]